jgi:hypothetical protein
VLSHPRRFRHLSEVVELIGSNLLHECPVVSGRLHVKHIENIKPVTCLNCNMICRSQLCSINNNKKTTHLKHFGAEYI